MLPLVLAKIGAGLRITICQELDLTMSWMEPAVPLAGGSADKAGNSYERRWTVFALLDILAGDAVSMRIEVPGLEGEGAEFQVTDKDGTKHWHQAKRQRAAGPWTIASLASEQVLQSWWKKVAAGDRCVFVTSSGCAELAELAERAKAAQSWTEFDSVFIAPEQQRIRFARLQEAWGTPPSIKVFEALTRVDVKILGENELAGWIRSRIINILNSNPGAVAAVLAQMADDHCHREVSVQMVLDYLRANLDDVKARSAGRAGESAYRSVLRDMIARTPTLLSRSGELAEIREFVFGPAGYRWIVGSPWAGKTALAAHAAADLDGRVDLLVYFIQGRRSEADSSKFLNAIGDQLSWILGEDPHDRPDTTHVTSLWERAVLAAERRGRPILLVVDGLDEDLRTAGLPSIASLLPRFLGNSGHVLVTSRPNPAVPDDVDVDHPIRQVQPVQLVQSIQAHEIEQRATQELNFLMASIIVGDRMTALARRVLGTLSVARAALTPHEIAEIDQVPVREVKAVILDYAARVLEPVGGNGGYQFAHQALLDTCIHILKDDGEWTQRINAVVQWGSAAANNGWPSATTSMYLLSQYPVALLAAGMECDAIALVTDPNWIVASLAKTGPGAVYAVLTLVAAASGSDSRTEVMRRVVAAEIHHLASEAVLDQPGYAMRQLTLGALRTKAGPGLLGALTSHVCASSPTLVPKWTSRSFDPALTQIVGETRGKPAATAFLHDGRSFITCDASGDVKMWSTDGTEDPQSLASVEGWITLSVASASRCFAVSSEDWVYTWDLDVSPEPLKLRLDAEDVAIAPDGKWLYVADSWDGVWAIDLQACERPVEAVPLVEDDWLGVDRARAKELRRRVSFENPAEPLAALQVAEGGNVLIGVSYSGEVVRWDLRRSASPMTTSHRLGRIDAAAISQDGHTAVVATSDETIWLVHPRTRNRPRRKAVARSEVLTIAIDPMCRSAVLVTADGEVHHLGLEDEAQARVLGRHDDQTGPLTLYAEPADMLDSDEHTRISVLPPGYEFPAAAALSHDGRAITIGHDRHIRLWDIAAAPISPNPTEYQKALTHVAINRDNRFALIADADGNLSTWDLADNPERVAQVRGKFKFLSFRADGVTAVSVGTDHEIRIWPLERPHESLTVGWYDGEADDFALSNSGKFLVGFADVGRIQLFRLDEPAEPLEIGRGTPGLRALAMAGANDIFVTAHIDRSIRTWRLGPTVEGRTLGKLPGAAIRSIAVNADGSRIATGRDDGTIQFWNLDLESESPKVLGEVGGPPIRAIRLDSKGNHAVTLSISGAIKLWKAEDPWKVVDLTYDSRIGLDFFITPDDQYVLASLSTGVAMWDLNTGLEVARAMFGGMSKLAIGSRATAGRSPIATYSRELGLTSWDLIW